MHGPRNDASQTGPATPGNEGESASELSILRDVLRMLPNGVTVQDEQGRLLLANDAAAQLQIGADGAPQHEQRREALREAFRTGRAVVVDDKTGDKYAGQVDKAQDVLQDKTGAGDTNP